MMPHTRRLSLYHRGQRLLNKIVCLFLLSVADPLIRYLPTKRKFVETRYDNAFAPRTYVAMQFSLSTRAYQYDNELPIKCDNLNGGKWKNDSIPNSDSIIRASSMNSSRTLSTSKQQVKNMNCHSTNGRTGPNKRHAGNFVSLSISSFAPAHFSRVVVREHSTRWHQSSVTVALNATFTICFEAD